MDEVRWEKAWKAVYDENFANKGRCEPWTGEDDTTWRSKCFYQFDRDQTGNRLPYGHHRTTIGLQFAATYWYHKFEKEDAANIKEEHVQMVIEQTACTRDEALSALKQTGSDVVASILSLTTKGCSGDLVILDEAAYASPDLVFETIFPLLEVKNTAFIAISTVLDEFNFFSKLLALKDDDGDEFFDVIMIDLTCTTCKRHLPKSRWKECEHVDDTVIPPWKSKEKYMRSKIIQTADPNIGRNARESMGLIEGDYNRALNEAFVKEAMDRETRKYHTVGTQPNRIYVAIDPDGGGKGSRMSVVSGFVCRGTVQDMEMDELPGTLVITGVDAKRCESDKESIDLVMQHIAKIRNRPLYEDVQIILIPENQLGHFHTRIENKFVKIPRCRTFHDHNKEKPGVRKDAERTKEYVIRTNDMLERKLIKFARDWFTNSEKDYGGTKEGVASELRDQMLRYCYDEHGKLTGKINGNPDDLCIGFEMLAYYSSVIEFSSIYEDYRIKVV